MSILQKLTEGIVQRELVTSKVSPQLLSQLFAVYSVDLLLTTSLAFSQ